MNSEDPRSNLFLVPKGNGNRTQYVTLVSAVILAFLFTLALYTWQGGNASSRLGYATFVSVVPAIGAFLLLRLTKISLRWLGVAVLYFILFLVVVAIAVLQLHTQFR
jgi:hypothetical protein